MEDRTLNKYAKYLVKVFSTELAASEEHGVTVNPVIAEIASWYEKLRNAIEYREDEVILRATIERILKRRTLLGGSGKTIASPLVRELVWARYFPDGSIAEKTVASIENTIDLYLQLRKQAMQLHGFKDATITRWIYQLMSSQIQHILNPNPEEETMNNLIFHAIKDNIVIEDDKQETTDVQIYLAIRRAYAKEDQAFLRYDIFAQMFGQLSRANLASVASGFKDYYKEAEFQLTYPLRYRIYGYVKKHVPPFLILEDILRMHKGRIEELIADKSAFEQMVIETCEARYSGIASKVRRAIIRSVIFILLSKAFLAFAVEGTYENIVYGEILWSNILINILIPVLLMLFVGMLIKTPGKKNSEQILGYIEKILFAGHPKIGHAMRLRRNPQKSTAIISFLFPLLWLGAFILSFGLMVFALTKLHFSIISQIFFLFFLAIVSFLAYRINQTAHLYTVDRRQNLLTPLIDFFFMPIARVGRYLTEGISQINIFLFILDFIFETPFKGIFAFAEQWFIFLHAKREELD